MKKVCFVVPRSYYLFNPNAENANDKVGGAQKQAYLLSSELAKDKGFDVNFILADFNQHDFEVVNNVKLWKSFNFKSNIIKRIKVLIKTIKKVNADYYIFRSADAGVAFITIILKVFFKKKVLYMLASNFETSHKGLKQNSGLMSALLMPITYKFANNITAQSKEQFNLFTKYRKREPDKIIKNIIPIGSYKDTTSRKIILWIGRLNPNKNPNLFVELAKMHTDEQFVMIAPIVLEYKSYGSDFVKKHQGQPNLTIKDFVKPEIINQYYRNAKIYVMSSESEGFSNTMAEAFAYSCPVLSLKVNPDNIFTEQNVGLCACNNTALFFDYFKKLLSDKKLTETLTQSAKKYISSNHDKNLIINEFKKLFY